jgi:hypothetical protein
MKKKLILLGLILYIGYVMAVPHAWINEIHYDNVGTDINEFVEVVVESPEGWYLGDLALYMYNGYDGQPYCLDTVDEFELGERIGPFQFYTWYQRGIQNDTEGMILVFKDILCDIIAYEGSFLGTNEPALGKIFPDIGVYETGYDIESNSIYLTGMPGSDWEYGAATPGALNNDQHLSEVGTAVAVSSFTAKACDDYILLRWQSESECENCSYRLYRNRSIIGNVEGSGTTSLPRKYFFRDKGVKAGIEYEYILSSIDYNNVEIFIDTILSPKIALPLVVKPFTLGFPFPNPSNPISVIPLSVSEPSHYVLSLIDLKGRKIKNIFNSQLEPGNYQIPVSLKDIPSGKYYIRCGTQNAWDTIEIIVTK